jgi:ABC-type multidrug transport system fused ATPase/permease subunit
VDHIRNTLYENSHLCSRDVSFSYPNSKSERASLSGVSFTIQPGQLVVIVGTNGSGKSTIIKLLSRFYEPTSGSILIDGIPIEEYSVVELRKGIAMLTQEHQLFPLSVEENIKLGSSEAEAMDDRGKIEEAVLGAGAEGIVKGFSDGYDTVLEPVTTGYLSYAGQQNKELEAMQKKLGKPASVSGEWLHDELPVDLFSVCSTRDSTGGEKQKLVAYV